MENIEDGVIVAKPIRRRKSIGDRLDLRDDVKPTNNAPMVNITTKEQTIPMTKQREEKKTIRSKNSNKKLELAKEIQYLEASIKQIDEALESKKDTDNPFARIVSSNSDIEERQSMNEDEEMEEKQEEDKAIKDEKEVNEFVNEKEIVITPRIIKSKDGKFIGYRITTLCNLDPKIENVEYLDAADSTDDERNIAATHNIPQKVKIIKRRRRRSTTNTPKKKQKKSKTKKQKSPKKQFETQMVTRGQSRKLQGQQDVPLPADLNGCRDILKQLIAHGYGVAFTNPIDTDNENEYPNYLDIVEQPMDFSTILTKLNQYKYSKIVEFEEDVHLVFNNAMLYFEKYTDLYVMAETLQGIFNNKLAKLKSFLERSNQLPAASTPSKPSKVVDERSPVITQLQKSLQYMRREITRLKNLRKPSSKRSAPQKRRKRLTRQNAEPMTKEEKKVLSDAINRLNENQLGHIVKIIEEKMPEYIQNDQEIVIDIATLDNYTLRCLERYVEDAFKPKAGKPAKRASRQSLPALSAQAQLQLLAVREVGTQNEIDDIQLQLEKINSAIQSVTGVPVRGSSLLPSSKSFDSLPSFPPSSSSRSLSGSDSSRSSSESSGSYSDSSSDSSSSSSDSDFGETLGNLFSNGNFLLIFLFSLSPPSFSPFSPFSLLLLLPLLLPPPSSLPLFLPHSPLLPLLFSLLLLPFLPSPSSPSVASPFSTFSSPPPSLPLFSPSCSFCPSIPSPFSFFLNYPFSILFLYI